MSRCYRRPTPRAGRDFIFTTFSNRQGSCIFALAAALGEQQSAKSVIVSSGLDLNLINSVETMARAYGINLLGVSKSR